MKKALALLVIAIVGALAVFGGTFSDGDHVVPLATFSDGD